MPFLGTKPWFVILNFVPLLHNNPEEPMDPNISYNGAAYRGSVPAIAAQGLRKLYGQHVAVNNANLLVWPGGRLKSLSPAGNDTSI